jgi:predicted ATPase/DNA-binding XRE family transcriptional regulator
LEYNIELEGGKVKTDELITSFGYWVRRRRKALDLTQAELAQRVGCALVTLKKIEWDERRPSPQMAERLADYLAIPAAERDQFLRMARGEFVTATLSPSAGVEARLSKYNLPSQATPFIGREKELADITRRLEDPTCRLLTLVGPGGIGKTRLAIQAAQHLVDAQPTELIFVHGIIFVPLTPVSSLSGLVSAIAEAANFTFYSNVPPQQQLLDYLREKEMLLVLDNFEQLLTSPEGEDVSGADLIAEILAVTPAVKLLVTSREALNLQEAWFHPIAGMAFPEPPPKPSPSQGEGWVGVEAYDAVRLFGQSARRARVGFSLAAERESVARICQLVEGMPLGIELAAAWLKTLACDQIAHEIERSLDILSTRLHNVPERHRSMRAVFEQSWRLLAEAEQTVLQRLSVFQGGFQQEAAEPVAGASLVTLAILVEKSLLQVTAGGRYQMHELLRQFAGEKLAQRADEEKATRQRHSDYYLGLLRACEPRFSGQEQPEALDEISLEIDNIRMGWGWVVDQGHIEAINEVVAGLYNFYELRSRYQEGEELFTQAIAQLRQVEGLNEQPSFAVVLNRLAARRGAFYYFLGDYETANKHLLESLNSAGQPSEQVFALTRLGEVAIAQARPAISEAWLRKSLAICREIGDQHGVTKALLGLADVKLHFGDHAAGLELVRESLAISRQLGRPDLVARMLEAVAWSTNCLGAYRESAAYWQESLIIYEKIGNERGVAVSRGFLGWVAWCMGESGLSQAIAHYQKALTICRQIGYRTGISVNCGDLAVALGEFRNYDLAIQYGLEGLAVAKEIGEIRYITYNLYGLGAATCGLGNLQASRIYLAEALHLAWKAQHIDNIMNILFYFATLLVKESHGRAGPELFDPQKKTKALELLAMVIGHPAPWQPIKDRAARLQAQLEAELPPEVVAAALERGKSRPLAEVVVEMLNTDC